MGQSSAHWESVSVLVGQVADGSIILFSGTMASGLLKCFMWSALWQSPWLDRGKC